MDVRVSLTKNGEEVSYELLGHPSPRDITGSIERLVSLIVKAGNKPVWPFQIDVR